MIVKTVISDIIGKRGAAAHIVKLFKTLAVEIEATKTQIVVVTLLV